MPRAASITTTAALALAVALACGGTTTVTPAADAGAPCTTKDDCAAGDSVCKPAACVAGHCAYSVQAGLELPTQRPGDCQKDVCGASGEVESVPDATDVPSDDGNPCTADTCESGAPAHPKKQAGTACTPSDADAGAGACTSSGICAVCNPGEQRCDGTTPEACGQDGLWKRGAACAGPTPACDKGACVPICSALDTSAGGHVEIADATDLRLSAGSFTVEAWVLANDYDNPCQEAIVTKRGPGNQDGWFFSVNGKSTCGGTQGRLWWHQSGGGDPYLQGNAQTPIGAWTHVAYTYDAGAGSGTLWVGGKNVGGGKLASPNAATTAVLRLGQDSDGQSYGWHGWLDDVRVSNVARYNAPFQPANVLVSDAQTVAVWNFDEASGDAIDASGHQHAGKLVGAAKRVTGPTACR